MHASSEPFQTSLWQSCLDSWACNANIILNCGFAAAQCGKAPPFRFWLFQLLRLRDTKGQLYRIKDGWGSYVSHCEFIDPGALRYDFPFTFVPVTLEEGLVRIGTSWQVASANPDEPDRVAPQPGAG